MWWKEKLETIFHASLYKSDVSDSDCEAAAGLMKRLQFEVSGRYSIKLRGHFVSWDFVISGSDNLNSSAQVHMLPVTTRRSIQEDLTLYFQINTTRTNQIWTF